MNDEFVYVYKIKDNRNAVLYRIYGNQSHIHLPMEIQGYPVCEIGPYCFSSRQHIPKDALYSGSIENLYELAGNSVESIFVSDSITFINSHAFYNCKALQNVSISSSVQELGSDVFVNATKLHSVQIRENVSKPTIIRSVLRQISWDVDVHFHDLSLFYPEYYEVYDEIGPAHIFGMNIQGEGFRLRQCINKDVILLDEYDSVFEKLCIEESVQTLLHFALMRFVQRPDFYKAYLCEHEKELLKYKSLSIDLIEQLLIHKVLSKEGLDTLIAQNESAEMVTKLIAYKKKYFPIQKKKYSFEDF